MFKYSINMAWSDEDESYVANIPEFPYLSAFGDTPEEAAEEAKLAAEGIIAVMLEDGEVLPEPQKLKTFSGQTRLRMPVSLHERLTLAAEREKVSFNTYVVCLLEGKSACEAAYHEAKRDLQMITSSFIEKAGREYTAVLNKTVGAGQVHDYSLNFDRGEPTVRPTERSTFFGVNTVEFSAILAHA